MRLSALTGLCVLILAGRAVVACNDSDGPGLSPTGGSGGSSAGSAGSAGKSSGGGGASAGSSSKAGGAGTMSAAGEDSGGAAGAAGAAGAGGTDIVPAQCTTNADCADVDPCTDDACTNGQCVHTNNTADCDDLSSCTPGQDTCKDGVCSGTLDLNVCPACDVPSNIVKNCDFSMGLTSWADTIGFQGGAATQTVVNGRNVIDISAGGEGIYSVQPRQEPLTIKHGMHYKLRMVAGSSVDRDIVIALTQAAGQYKVYSTGDNVGGGFTLHLTKQMKPFEFDFTMTDPDDDNVKLEIKLGGAAGNPSSVYFDDVAVEEVKCTANPSCDDGNGCTADACDVASGTCSWTPTTDACADDGDLCTKDVCAAGACTHPAADNNTVCASDADPCTLDQCQGGQCTHTFDTLTCNCSNDTQCNDSNVCTDDHCNAGTCEHTNNTASCDDANACTSTDVCAAGVCGGTNNTDPCDDHDACTVPDTCSAGACSAGTNVCFDCTAGGNLLTNCNFANGTTGWQEGFFSGAAGTQSVVDGRLVVNITNGGTDTYQVQPRQEGLVLMQGTTYVVKFNAMASVARPINVSVTHNGGMYESYSTIKTFNLTPVMQLITFEFPMSSAPVSNELPKLEFDLGGTVPNTTLPNTVTLDNVFIGVKP